MKRALLCFLAISFILCLGGYGQAAQVMDRVSFTVTGVTFEGDGDFSYDDVAMEDLIDQTLDLFVVVYDDTSTTSSIWDNDTGEWEEDAGGLIQDMTFTSDGSYLLGRDLLGLLNVFNIVQPAYPSIRQVYGNAEGLTVYDYVFRMFGSGFTFDYTSDEYSEGRITLHDGEGNIAIIGFVGNEDSVQRVIINRPELPGNAKAPNPLPIGGRFRRVAP